MTEPEVIELFEDTPSKAPETPIHKLKDPLYDPVEDQQRANRRTTTNKRPSNETVIKHILYFVSFFMFLFRHSSRKRLTKSVSLGHDAAAKETVSV